MQLLIPQSNIETTYVWCRHLPIVQFHHWRLNESQVAPMPSCTHKGSNFHTPFRHDIHFSLYTHSNSHPVWTSPYCQSQMCGIHRICQEASIFQSPDRKMKSKLLWNTRSFQKNVTVFEKSPDSQRNIWLFLQPFAHQNKQSIHIHDHRQRWCQQYSIDVSMGTAPIHP